MPGERWGSRVGDLTWVRLRSHPRVVIRVRLRLGQREPLAALRRGVGRAARLEERKKKAAGLILEKIEEVAHGWFRK
jgi:hypothetical protein